MLRWKGKFTDPRITDGSDLRKIEKHNIQSQPNFKKTIEQDLEYLIDMNKQDEISTALEEQDDTWTKEYKIRQSKERLRNEDEATQLANILNKYKKTNKNGIQVSTNTKLEKDDTKNQTVQNEIVKEREFDDTHSNDMLLDFRDTDAQDLQNNHDNSEQKENITVNHDESEGNEFHKMFGWQSFRYGKNKHLYKKLGRTARAITNNKKVQIKQKLKERKLREAGINQENTRTTSTSTSTTNTNKTGEETQVFNNMMSWNAPRLRPKKPNGTKNTFNKQKKICQ